MIYIESDGCSRGQCGVRQHAPNPVVREQTAQGAQSFSYGRTETCVIGYCNRSVSRLDDIPGDTYNVSIYATFLQVHVYYGSRTLIRSSPRVKAYGGLRSGEEGGPGSYGGQVAKDGPARKSNATGCVGTCEATVAAVCRSMAKEAATKHQATDTHQTGSDGCDTKGETRLVQRGNCTRRSLR